MRIRKKHHLLTHGVAAILTGGLSAPISAGMIGAKAARNKKADREVEYLAAAMQAQACPGCGAGVPPAAKFCANCGAKTG